MCFCFRFRPWWSEQMWFGPWENLWCLPILQRCGWGICPDSFRSSVTKVRKKRFFTLVSRAVGVSLLDCDWGNNRNQLFWGNKGFDPWPFSKCSVLGARTWWQVHKGRILRQICGVKENWCALSEEQFVEYAGKRMGLRFSFLRMYNLMKSLIKLEFYSSCNRISTLLVLQRHGCDIRRCPNGSWLILLQKKILEIYI